MFKTALNKNIIPHTWKLANIVPIPKPNKDTDKGTSYRPISLLSAFDTINIHTLIRKLLQTNIPGTIIKFIANYIKGRKAYTTYRNHTSKQRQFKTGVPQGGVLSPTLFNIDTSNLPPHSAPVQVMAYADDITITSTHTSTSAAKKYIHPYLHKVFLPGQNNTTSY